MPGSSNNYPKESLLPFFLLNAVLLLIFVTWIFQHTGGSVLIMVLIHFTVNICAAIIGVLVPVLVVLMLIANNLIVIVALGAVIIAIARSLPSWGQEQVALT